MIKINSSRIRQRGITSLFVVIFATLLLSVMTLSFAYLMNREAQRSSDNELSQSAYDSAMAGVEDAKRAVMLAQSGNVQAQEAINGGSCDTVALAGVSGVVGGETIIESTTDGVGSDLNQAYTCVTVSLNSDDYISSVNEMSSTLVPLKGDAAISSVQIEWHSAKGAELDLACGISDVSVDLCPMNQWGGAASVPAILRVQTITPGASFDQAKLDTDAAGGTVFLYPKENGRDEFDMNEIQRYVGVTGTSGGAVNQPQQAKCVPEVTSSGYHCKVTLRLADNVPANSNTSFLRLTPIYNSTSFRIKMIDATGDTVQFVGVQPVVDSTGRANDLFRRVEARLNLSSEVSYPEFAVEVEGSLCKDFYVYEGGSNRLGGVCNP